LKNNSPPAPSLPKNGKEGVREELLFITTPLSIGQIERGKGRVREINHA